MPLYTFKNFVPQIGLSVFIAPSADVIGRVKLGNHVNVWYQTVIRGDVNEIVIGENTNVQDLSMLHVTKDFPLYIGKNVSIAHSVTLHGCTVEDHCLIGMGAVIMDGAVIGKNSVVAGGAIVPPGKKFPPYSMIMGNPAVSKRELTDTERELYGNHYISYVGYKDEFLDKDIVKLIGP